METRFVNDQQRGADHGLFFDLMTKPVPFQIHFPLGSLAKWQDKRSLSMSERQKSEQSVKWTSSEHILEFTIYLFSIGRRLVLNVE